MRRISAKQHTIRSAALENAALINRLIHTNNDPQATAARFSEFLSEHNFDLLFYGIYDEENRYLPKIIYSGMPQRMVKLCEVYDPKMGCPAVQHALDTRQSFEATTLEYANPMGFSAKRYIQELKGLGFDEVAIVPVEADENVHVLFVGLNDFKFHTSARLQLETVIGRLVASLLVRYPHQLETVKPETDQIDSGAAGNLSNLEIECLRLCARGKNNFQISAQLGYSEHVVARCFVIACDKLGVSNRVHAVTKAHSLGLITIQ